MNTKSKLNLGTVVLYVSLFILSTMCVIPLVATLMASLSDQAALNEHGFGLWPREFTTLAYEYLFQQPAQLISAYKVTLFVTVAGTLLGTLLNAWLAYPLSRKNFVLRNQISFYVFFTMLFHGGLVPWYILISRYLHLKDTIWVLIIPYIVNAWYILLLRTFFKGLPEEVMESAKIEGAGEFTIFFRLVVPLSTPVLATIGLFYSLQFWNDWYLGLLFVESASLKPLQLLLYNLQSAANALSLVSFSVGVSPPSLTIRMATVMITIAPLMFIYLVFQKHFVRGLTIGALKG